MVYVCFLVMYARSPLSTNVKNSKETNTDIN